MKNFKELLNTISEDFGDIGNSKAIFVVGVPGSGKDVVIRGIMKDISILEMNHHQAYSVICQGTLTDKSPLLITAPATDIDTISQINEDLTKIGYATNMVFVNTTNTISIDRNSKLNKTLSEEIRYSRWCSAQENLDVYTDMFEDIIVVDNIDTLTKFNESIDRVCTKTKLFLECTCKPTNTKQDISKFTNGAAGRDKKHSNLLSDNNCPTCQLVRISGKPDNVKYGDVAQNTGYSNRAYHEQAQPSLKISPEKKIPNFQKDKDSKVKPKYNTQGGKFRPVDGIGDTWSDRPNQGSGAFGNAQVEQKQFMKFRKEILEGLASGDTGYELGTVNSTDQEKMRTPLENELSKSPPRIKKKKVG